MVISRLAIAMMTQLVRLAPLLDPPLQLTDLGLEHDPEIRVHRLPVCDDALSCSRADLAKSRLRISTICARRVVKALRTRSFSLGNFRPASGRKTMNRAMGSASIRSIFAPFPRYRAKALIWARDSCTASIPASASRTQSIHSWPPVTSKPILEGAGRS